LYGGTTIIHQAKQGSLVGYLRASPRNAISEQRFQHLVLDHIFIDPPRSKYSARPQLLAALATLKPGDTLVVCRMDCLAVSLMDLYRLVRRLTSKSIAVRFLKENLTFFGGDAMSSSAEKLSVLKAAMEFERAMAVERRGYAIRRALSTKTRKNAV
jgi:DNA invertase Pin-like site-specific DNA recombinase